MAGATPEPQSSSPSEGDPSFAADSSSAQRVAETYRTYGRELWAMFFAVCGDPERAWDAVQQSFLRFQEYNLQEHNGTLIQDPRAWLLQVGKNWLRDVARRRENAWRAPHPPQWDELAHRELDPAGSASRADLLLEVRRMLNELRTEDREVLVLRYGLGWSSARIAAAVGGSVQAVDMRLSRARQRLGGLLTARGIDGLSLGE